MRVKYFWNLPKHQLVPVLGLLQPKSGNSDMPKEILSPQGACTSNGKGAEVLSYTAFFVLYPYVCAEMLAVKLEQDTTSAYLLNTSWVRGQVARTEEGITKLEATFSACFEGPCPR